MFFNNKPSEGLPMFDQQRIGANIMKARKNKGLTQMALADALGVSFQAVSNWERGQTCPDIANLSELSRLLDISIDELLGNKRAAQITKELVKEKTPELQPEELVQVAPLLTEEQADKAAEENDLDFKSLKELAPYLSEAVMGEAVTAVYRQTGNLKAAVDLLCYVDEDTLLPLAREVAQKDGLKGLKALSPYLDWDELGDLVLDAVKRGDTGSIAELIFYLDEDLMGQVARELFRQQGINAIVPIACYLDEDVLDDIAREALKNGKLRDLKPLTPYLSGDLGDA